MTRTFFPNSSMLTFCLEKLLKNKIDSIINLSSNNPAQVYFLANYLFDKSEYALASRTLEHFILNFPNDTDA